MIMLTIIEYKGWSISCMAIFHTTYVSLIWSSLHNADMAIYGLMECVPLNPDLYGTHYSLWN